jgi:eukaryotic-like serine/threonine-protein kinase
MKRSHFTHKVGQSTTHVGLSTLHSQALVKLLLQFEQAWATPARLSIEQVLEQHPLVPRSVSLEGLLLTEWSLRQKQGDAWTVGEYSIRFPDDAAIVDKAKRALGLPSELPSSHDSDQPHSQDAPIPPIQVPFKPMGRFLDVQQLGSGGMGMVFTAFDPERNTKVALKTIKHVGGEAIYRFKREFRALADIVHPNLCPLYELLMIDGVWFITMPFVDGVDLVRYARKSAQHHPSATRSMPTRNLSNDIHSSWSPSTVGGESSSTSFGEADSDFDFEIDSPSCRSMSEFCNERVVRDVFAQIARGIGALHQAGRLHRDLKPANVLVDQAGQVFILDFGLVAEGYRSPSDEVSDHLSLDSNSESQLRLEPFSNPERTDPDRTEVHHGGPRLTHSIEGTPHYMAPEQAMGLADLSPACDWYAFGVMLFHVLTGSLPFSGPGVMVIELKKWQDAPRPQELAQGIPDDLAELCIGLLQRDPNLRPNVRDILRVLTGAKETQSQPISADHRLPFVGRDRLLAALAELTRGVREGRPAIVRMHGRSGAGKSSTIQRFLDSFRSPQDMVLKGRCYEQESVPYKALDGIMDSLSSTLSQMSPGKRKKYLSSNAAELARVFESLQRIPELATAAERLPSSEPGELRRRAMAGLRDLLSRLSDDYLLTLAIDDFQWGDVESASILLDLYCSPAPPKSLLLISYRDEYESTSECLRKWLHAEAHAAAKTEIVDMPIGPLTDTESASLVSELLPADLEHRDAYSAIIVRESAGNPFFVIELALAASQGRKLPIQVDGEKQRILDEVLWSRIQELPEEVKRLLEVVAVAGQPTTMDVIYEAAGFAIRDPQILTRLRIERLVRSSGPSLDSELEAYHDRIRETMVAHLPASAKLHHHLALATSLEHKGDADAETLAHHFVNAGVPDKAGLYLEMAADKASESLAFDRAAGLYRQALALWPQGSSQECSLRSRLGTALANAGRGEQAAIEFAAAADGTVSDERLELQRKSAYQYCISGHVEKGKSAISELLDSVGLAMPNSTVATIGSLLWHRTRLYWRGLGVTLRPESSVPKKLLQQVDLAWSAAAGMSMFELISGCRLSTVTLRLALAAGEPRRLVRSLCWEAVQRINAGGPEIATGVRMIAMAERIAADLDDPYASTMIPFAQGIGEFMQGNWSRSIQVLDDASTQFAKTCLNVHWELGTARLFVLYSMYWNGDLSEYQRRANALHAAALSCGDFYAELSLGTFDLPFSRLVSDQPAEASQLINTYMDRLQLGRYSLQDMYALMQKTNLNIYSDRPEQAWSLIQKGWKDLQQSMLMLGEHIRMACWELRARTAIACVDYGVVGGQMRKEALRAIGKIEKERLQRFSPLPFLYRAGLAAADRDLDSAVLLLRQGIQQAEQHSLGIYLQPARWQLGQLLQGDEGDHLVASAEAEMQSEGVVNPARFASMLVPGFSHTRTPHLND